MRIGDSRLTGSGIARVPGAFRHRGHVDEARVASFNLRFRRGAIREIGPEKLPMLEGLGDP